MPANVETPLAHNGHKPAVPPLNTNKACWNDI